MLNQLTFHNPEGRSTSNLLQRRRREGAFTLMEMLVVVGIIGMVIAIGLPSIEKLARPSGMGVAQRQLLDLCTYARHLSLSTRSEIHICFITQELAAVDTNRWSGSDAFLVNQLLGSQNRGYALYADRSVGDQPGRSVPKYLTDWDALPDHIFISTNEFFFNFTYDRSTNDAPFLYKSIRFPHVDSTNQLNAPNLNTFVVPMISFNSRGQLSSGRDTYIPLSQGSVVYRYNADGSRFAKQVPSTIDPTPRATAIISGVRYYVRSGTGSVDYNGDTYSGGDTFVGTTASSTYTGSGQVYVFEGIYINWLTGRARIIKPGVNS